MHSEQEEQFRMLDTNQSHIWLPNDLGILGIYNCKGILFFSPRDRTQSLLHARQASITRLYSSPPKRFKVYEGRTNMFGLCLLGTKPYHVCCMR